MIYLVKSSGTDLIVFQQDCDLKGEGRVDRERRAIVLFLLTVVTIQTGFENDCSWLSVVPRVEVKGSICISPSTVLQIDNNAGNKEIKIPSLIVHIVM